MQKGIYINIINQVRSSIITAVVSILSTFIIAFVFFRFIGPIPFSVNQTTTNKASTFDVTGEGTESVIPDQAQANFGITTNGSSVSEVQTNVNQTINKVTEALKNLGINSKDIKTTNYSINPDYDYTSNSIKGYSASAQIQVTFHDFSKLNQAFDSATATGANNAGQLYFSLSDDKQKEAEAKATKQAIDQAKEKAQTLASLSGIKLGKLINVQENSPINPRPMMMSAQSAGSPADQKTEVSPGTNEVKVTVTLSYETL